MTLSKSFHEYFMHMAMREAAKAAAAGEVPTGCVIVRMPTAADLLPASAKLLGRAHNQTELLKDPTAHAEMIAITQAAAAAGDWRLDNTILYVTKEPCPMCAGAIVLARNTTVVYGLPDPKRGGNSVFNLFDHPGLNHRPTVISGILQDECHEQFAAFFRACRHGLVPKPATAEIPPP
ncbi:MAG: nucleoside deaminase [Lentisphaerae bacterium]|nr:nucleoside deaminase [Lentisphaerota bacterium]